MKVSVIIPNYNYGRFLGDAIRSVLGQTAAVHEVIVVDDGSSDDSRDIAKSFGSAVRLIEQANAGVGTARNRGVNESSGDIVAFLDADDIWLPTKVEKQIEVLLSDTECGMVSCHMGEVRSDGTTPIVTHEHTTDSFMAEKILLLEAPGLGVGSATLLRRSVFEKIGGFDERAEMHPSEDWELSYRVASVARIRSIPETLVLYRNHGDNGHLNVRRMERSMSLAFEKIFASGDFDVAFKNKCEANLHNMLAGSFFSNGEYQNFIGHALKGVSGDPASVMRYLSYPLRSLKRLMSR